MEDAFIAIVEEARARQAQTAGARRVRHDVQVSRIAAHRRLGAQRRRNRCCAIRAASPSASLCRLLLILLFGYGLSLDVTKVPVAVVLEDPSPAATELAAGFQLSPYFEPELLTSMARAEELMLARKVDGIVRIRPDFARNLTAGECRSANTRARRRCQPRAHHSKLCAGRGRRNGLRGAAARGIEVVAGPVTVQNRMWFNEANESRYFLVPGLIVLIMTLIGALLTSLVMAREWERGTLEALFVTPVRTDEILLGKTIPYFILGMIGLVLCLLAAKFLFAVPFRGSVTVLAGASMLYLLVALGIGLLISSAVKSQFVASQITLLVSFLPAVMLSGFLFDLRSMPDLVRTDHLPAAGALLRRLTADDFSRRRYLAGDYSQRSGARRHGRGAGYSHAKGHYGRGLLNKPCSTPCTAYSL